MTTYCDGKQGTFLNVKGTGIDRDIIGNGSVEVIQTTSSTVVYQTWGVYTAAVSNGQVVEAFRGYHGKNSNDGFMVYKPTSTTNRLTRTSAPTGSLTSWTSSTTSWINRLVYSHGGFPVTTYTTEIKETSGLQLFKASQGTGHFTVTLLECGCDLSDCQMGTFPGDFCCTNCAQQSGILNEIIAALQARNNG